MAFFGTQAYQSWSNRDFWNNLTPEDNFVAAMMAVGELNELAFFTFIGSIIGISLALLSLYFRKRLFSVGTAALIFSSLPVFLLISALLYMKFVSGTIV
jgi:hypothetical protein